jgi:hypothetical protein
MPLDCNTSGKSYEEKALRTARKNARGICEAKYIGRNGDTAAASRIQREL